MNEEQRVSFILRHYYGYSIEEISTYFNVAHGTTKSRIHSVIQSMRKIIRIGGIVMECLKDEKLEEAGLIHKLIR